MPSQSSDTWGMIEPLLGPSGGGITTPHIEGVLLLASSGSMDLARASQIATRAVDLLRDLLQEVMDETDAQT